jgi:hypothetical protein
MFCIAPTTEMLKIPCLLIREGHMTKKHGLVAAFDEQAIEHVVDALATSASRCQQQTFKLPFGGMSSTAVVRADDILVRKRTVKGRF